MSSKRRLRRRQCESKVKHETLQQAWGAIRSMEKKRGHQGQMTVYRCGMCSKFHVGHAIGRNHSGDAWA